MLGTLSLCTKLINAWDIYLPRFSRLVFVQTCKLLRFWFLMLRS